MSIADLRKDYCLASLDEHDVDVDPIAQFGKWFSEARAAAVEEANAMTLSTVDAQHRPSSRIVLIKEFDQRGFTWFTNYNSRKGHELAQNPHACLLFFWRELERQVRIEGRVEQIAASDSDAYFHSRPLNSRLGALASDQSEEIADRAALEQKFAEAERNTSGEPQRPPHWGGYRLVPHMLEFWQGRPSRLHDRIVYTQTGTSAWSRKRLQP